MQTFAIIVAADAALGIGQDGTLPWQLPGDMAYFKKVTCEVSQPGARNAVIMGRKTWDSIPAKFRPLRNRLNIVLTRDTTYHCHEGVAQANSFESALQVAWNSDVERIFVIGGAAVFAEALSHPACDNVYFTDIKKTFPCDTFLPDFLPDYEHVAENDSAMQSENGTDYLFKLYRRRLAVKPGACVNLASTAP